MDVKELKAAFVNGSDFDLRRVISQAYTDMQPRTIAKHSRAVRKKCEEYLYEELERLLGDGVIHDFEQTHDSLCSGFLAVLNDPENGIACQQYGKAQKVVNIIFKFLSAYGKCEGYEKDCHLPVDSLVLKWLCGKETYNGTSWSNLTKEQYDGIRVKIADKIKSDGGVKLLDRVYPVENVLEADFFIWYSMKLKASWKAANNSTVALRDSLCDDHSCVISKDEARKLLRTVEELADKLKANFAI